MKCERCGKELSDVDLYCSRCGKAVFPEYMDEDDRWVYYKTDEELEQILKEEKETGVEYKADYTLMDHQSKKEEPEEKIEPEAPEESQNLQEETQKDIPREESLEAEEENEILEDNDDIFSDDEEEEEEADKVLTPKQKHNRRLKIVFAILFLSLCLAGGILYGLYHMKQLEKEKQDYYNSLKKSTVQTDVKSKEPPKEEVPEETKPKETVKEEKKQEYFKLVDAEKIDFSKYKKVQPTEAEGNSAKASDEYNYSAVSAADGDPTSSWQEGESGLGEGKGFKLKLDGNHKIRYIVLYLGNWRSDELWKYNARPQTLTIQVGDSQKKDVEFSNEKKKFCLSFDEPIDASYISMYVKSAYKGERWEDNCISEVEIYE